MGKRKNFTMIPKCIINSDVSGESLKLFCIITELSSQSGFCFATNEYLSERMKSSPKTIQRHIKELKELDFIKIAIYTHTGKTVRHIFPQKCEMAVDTNVPNPMDMVDQQ